MIFVHEKCPITVLKCSVEFYKNLETCLNAFGIQMLSYKTNHKIENKRRNNTKKRRRGGHQPNWADPGPKPTEQQPSPALPLFLSLTG
jgi:hypothetical protein